MLSRGGAFLFEVAAAKALGTLPARWGWSEQVAELEMVARAARPGRAVGCRGPHRSGYADGSAASPLFDLPERTVSGLGQLSNERIDLALEFGALRLEA